MKSGLKKFFAVFFIVIIVVGWYVTIAGIGPISPIQDRMKLGLDIKGGVYVVMEANTDLEGDELEDAMDQTQAVIEERVNQMGLSEPTVTTEGDKRIRVELPGAEDAEEAIEQIGKTAQLQFALADGTVVLDGGNVKDASVTTDDNSASYAVALKFDSEGGDEFYEATSLAYSGSVASAIEGVDNRSIMIILDDEIISAPVVQEPISGGDCTITGNFSQEEASNLAALINGGALPLELQEVNSSVQSAKIGYNALEMSIYAALIGFIAIMVLMVVAYKGMGIAADLALTFYILILINVMSWMGSVLTLPGIAGIILSIGMAVDANVIIFSRIREELEHGKIVRIAVHDGFRRALGTIMDSQITTLIAAVILYEIGTSSVKGFAWTFMIGIVISIFTALVVTQLYVSLFADGKRTGRKGFFGINKDNRASFSIRKELHFIDHRKVFYIISAAILVVGLVCGITKGLNYGIDFTGGTMIQMDMGEKVDTAEVEDAIAEYDLDPEIIYSGEDSNQIVIRTIESLDNDERAEVIDTINESFGTTNDDIVAQELFGPSIGKELRNNAILAILIAAACMFIYIRIRFSQWKFGGSALLGVLHDVLIVLSFYAIFNITVNNPFIAGILTVVGYSINDTIVVFDRIRENIRLMKADTTERIIDHSINQTLGRSLMTSITTLIVMIPLAIMAGDAIREFVLPLMVGVIAGGYSSITICSPFYYEFSRPGRKSKYKKQYQGKPKKKKDKDKEKENKLSAPEAEEKIAIEGPSTDVENKEIKSDNGDAANGDAAEEKKPETAGPKPAQKKPANKNEKRSKRYVKGNKR